MWLRKSHEYSWAKCYLIGGETLNNGIHRPIGQHFPHDFTSFSRPPCKKDTHKADRSRRWRIYSRKNSEEAKMYQAFLWQQQIYVTASYVLIGQHTNLMDPIPTGATAKDYDWRYYGTMGQIKILTLPFCPVPTTHRYSTMAVNKQFSVWVWIGRFIIIIINNTLNLFIYTYIAPFINPRSLYRQVDQKTA